MVHFPGFARPQLCIYCGVHRVYLCGFPHSEISGSKPTCGSPKLIAACHVLHRLLLPRHPPCALSSLTIKLTRSTPDCSRMRRENPMGQTCSSRDSSFSYQVADSRKPRTSKLRNLLHTPAGLHLLLALIKIYFAL